MSSSDPGARRTERLILILAVVIIVIIFVSAAAYFLVTNFSQNGVGAINRPRVPTYVTVLGTVETVGVSTSPVRIDFRELSSNNRYSASVTLSSGSSAQGTYSLSLLNQRSYNATVYWTGLFGSAGSCDGGSFMIDQASNASYVYNIRC